MAASVLQKVPNLKGGRREVRMAVLRTPAIESLEGLTSVACCVKDQSIEAELSRLLREGVLPRLPAMAQLGPATFVFNTAAFMAGPHKPDQRSE